MVAVRCAIFLSLLSMSSSQIWFPKKELGFVYNNGSPSARVKMEVFMDPLCIDSKAMYEPILRLARSYSPDTLQLRLHMFPLPYHTYAFYSSKAVYALQHIAPSINPFDWFELMYRNMTSFQITATMNETTESVLDRMGDLAASLGARKEEFKHILKSMNSEERETRLAWKYGATRGVHSTPMVFLNGVVASVSRPARVSVFTWTVIINDILRR